MQTYNDYDDGYGDDGNYDDNNYGYDDNNYNNHGREEYHDEHEDPFLMHAVPEEDVDYDDDGVVGGGGGGLDYEAGYANGGGGYGEADDDDDDGWGAPPTSAATTAGAAAAGGGVGDGGDDESPYQDSFAFGADDVDDDGMDDPYDDTFAQPPQSQSQQPQPQLESYYGDGEGYPAYPAARNDNTNDKDFADSAGGAGIVDYRSKGNSNSNKGEKSWPGKRWCGRRNMLILWAVCTVGIVVGMAVGVPMYRANHPKKGNVAGAAGAAGGAGAGGGGAAGGAGGAGGGTGDVGTLSDGVGGGAEVNNATDDGGGAAAVNTTVATDEDADDASATGGDGAEAPEEATVAPAPPPGTTSAEPTPAPSADYDADDADGSDSPTSSPTLVVDGIATEAKTDNIMDDNEEGDNDTETGPECTKACKKTCAINERCIDRAAGLPRKRCVLSCKKYCCGSGG